jgi:hypothetical protein
MVLPAAFFLRVVLGLGRVGGQNCFGRIASCTNGVGVNVGSCNGMARGTRREACGILTSAPGVPSGSVAIKGGLAHFGHPENAGACPRPARFDGHSRAVVIRELLLEAGQHPLGAITSPDSQRLVAGLAGELYDPYPDVASSFSS